MIKEEAKGEIKWEKRQDRNFHKILSSVVKENREDGAVLERVEPARQGAMYILQEKGHWAQECPNNKKSQLVSLGKGDS